MCTPLFQRLLWLKIAKYSCWMALIGMTFLTMGRPVSLADELSQAPKNQNTKPSVELLLTDHDFLTPQLNVLSKTVSQVKAKMTVTLTAYSSRKAETDNDPLITASGKWVKDGIVASNTLPFGTRIRIPKLFQDKIFVVEDRMNERYDGDHIDIWFAETQAAKEFGVRNTVIEIL